MSRHGELFETYTPSFAIRHQIEIWHDELNRYQLISSDNPAVTTQRAVAKMAQWDEMWARKVAAETGRLQRESRARGIEDRKARAAELTRAAQASLRKLETVLHDALERGRSFDWESLKDQGEFPEPKPDTYRIMARSYLLPSEQLRSPPPSGKKYRPRLNILDRIFTSRKCAKLEAAAALLAEDQKKWRRQVEREDAEYDRLLEEYDKTFAAEKAEHKVAVNAWEQRRENHFLQQRERNAVVDSRRERYLIGDVEEVMDYCDHVLAHSYHPDEFPQSYELDYNPESKLLIVEYQLPSLDMIATLREVKYVQSRDEFIEKHITSGQRNKLYDGILYQIALGTLCELFRADDAQAVSSIVFNGIVSSIDPGTGRVTTSCVLSLQADVQEFAQLDLGNVEPKACFKMLKGVGCAKLHTMIPVAPILAMERDDRRFTESYDVADDLEDGDNLAAMDWEDFEHLVRELFEKEFAANGSEVKVTRASRDGGVDAVVFDADPLHGGKIIIQAKRYTNVVGVSAVRDLYGTVMNEGANKGILVTTAYYGSDSYRFAKDKPLLLLNGGNLLHLLQKHGYKARINLKEAKQLAREIL